LSSDEKRPGYRNVVALGFVSFFTDMSTEMILGILPVYLVEELGATKVILGLIEGLAELTNYIFRMVSGFISDRVGRRKPFVFAGYFLSGIAKPLFAYATTWLDALIVRIVDRMGKGVRTAPRDALISQSIRERDAGKAFGIHRTLDQLGAVLGPLLAFILIPMVGVRTVFLASFIPALIALIILLIAVAEVATPPKSSRLLPEVSRVLSGKFLWLLLSLSIFNLGAYNFSFILVRASELGVAVLAAPIVYMLMNLTHTAVGIPSGILADRIGREKTLVLAMLMFAFTSLMLAYLSGAWIYGILLALIFGVFQGMYDTVSRAVVPRYVPEELRGSAYGAYYLVIGVSFLLGMSIVGMLWDYVGRTIAFTYSTILSALGATLLYLSVIRKS